jgi:hypothetical protein
MQGNIACRTHFMYFLSDALALAHCALVTGVLFLCWWDVCSKMSLSDGVSMVFIFYPQSVKGIAHGILRSSCGQFSV